MTVETVEFVHESVEMDMKLEMAKHFSMVTWTNYRSSTGKVDNWRVRPRRTQSFG